MQAIKVRTQCGNIMHTRSLARAGTPRNGRCGMEHLSTICHTSITAQASTPDSRVHIQRLRGTCLLLTDVGVGVLAARVRHLLKRLLAY